MSDEIEQQLEATLNDARAAAEVADEQLAVAQGKVDEMLAQARGNRTKCLDEVKRIEKTLRVYRGEPLMPPKAKAKQNGGHDTMEMPEELLREIYRAAKQLALADPDGAFSIHAAFQQLDGVGYDTVKAGFKQLTADEKIRKAGKRTGGTKYMLDRVD